MNFKALKEQFVKDIRGGFSESEASFLFFMILDHMFNWKRSDYLAHLLKEVGDIKQNSFHEIVTELLAGKPIQYVLGETYFYGLKLIISPNVLIPRPETEELVDWILENNHGAGHTQELNVLDIGTGSGCIAISLKKKLESSSVFAIDISEGALEVARRNAKLNTVKVAFNKGDMLTYQDENEYDVIVSNPPYVRMKEQEEMNDNVLDYEPHVALFVSDDNPLVFYKAIAEFAISHLKSEGLLYFEINEYLGKEMVGMLKNKGFKNIILKKDMQDKDRMICCRR
jgi:release factor glutamine methyltransferase